MQGLPSTDREYENSVRPEVSILGADQKERGLWGRDSRASSVRSLLRKHLFPHRWSRGTKTLGTTVVFRFFGLFFPAFAFSPFLIFLLQLTFFYWAGLQFENSLESIIETENSHHGAKCKRKKNFHRIFAQIFEQFRAHFTLNHFDFSRRTSVYTMPILVKKMTSGQR